MSKIHNLMIVAALLGGALPAAAASTTVMKPAADAKIARLDPAINSLIAPNAVIEKVATGFVFLEGPMWHQGTLWFSDLRGNKMYKMTPSGKVTLQLDHAGGLASFPAGANAGSNAMVTDKDGTVLMNQHGARRIVRLDKDLHITPFLERYEGKRFNSPNDLTFAPDGALWFTDPPYGFYDPAKPNADIDKNPAKEIKFNGVYRYKDGKLSAVITDLARPNGIDFTPDGKSVIISNSENKPTIHRYDVAADGSVSNHKIVVDLSKATGDGVPDGLRIDSKGDLWATGPGGIRIFSPSYKLLGQLQLPEVAANLTWGDDGKTLYIMGSTSVYRLKLLVAGKPALYAK